MYQDITRKMIGPLWFLLLISMATFCLKTVDAADLAPPAGVRFRVYTASPHVNKMFKAGSSCGVHQWYGAKRDNNYDYNDGSWFRVEDCPGYSGYHFLYPVTHYNCVANNIKFYFLSLQYYIMGLADRKIFGFRKSMCWKFVFNDNNEFQLSNLDGEKVYLRSHSEPYFGSVSNFTFNNRDQFFHLHYEKELSVVRVQFFLSKGKLQAKSPKVAAEQIFINNSTITQSQTLSVKYMQQKQHSWECTSGFKVTTEMGLSFKAGIPLFGELETSVKLGNERTQQWTTNTVSTESREVTYTVPIKVPPMKKIVAKVLVHESKGEVPYEMTLKARASGTEFKSYGKWKGVQTIRVFSEIHEMKLAAGKYLSRLLALDAL